LVWNFSGTFEILLGPAPIFGFMQKIAYTGGVILSLQIWTIPEGSGGSYVGGSGTTDIGTGIIYAVAFLGLILISATYGPSRHSHDYYIERRFPGWARIAGFDTSVTKDEAGSAAPARRVA
jgi:nitrite reductase (NO-forming)